MIKSVYAPIKNIEISKNKRKLEYANYIPGEYFIKYNGKEHLITKERYLRACIKHTGAKDRCSIDLYWKGVKC